MNAAELIKAVASLIWPLLASVAAFYLRAQIREALRALNKRIKEGAGVKLGPLEIMVTPLGMTRPPASLIGNWKYRAIQHRVPMETDMNNAGTDLPRHFEGSCSITETDGRLDISGTRQHDALGDRKWRSIFAYVDKGILRFYYAFLDGAQDDGFCRIELPQEPLAKMSGKFFQLAPGSLYGEIEFEKQA